MHANAAESKTTTDPRRRSDLEVLLELAREALATQGTAVEVLSLIPLLHAGDQSRVQAAPQPPPESVPVPTEQAVPLSVAAPKKQRRTRRSAAEALPEKPVAPENINWKQVYQTCPRCGHEGPVDPDFGLRHTRQGIRRQSWCVACRATVNYHTVPRKYAKRRR